MIKEIRSRRSLIFFPGNKPELFPKALKTGADIVAADLEDAIAPQDKDYAREATLKLYADLPETKQECIVRVNSIRTPEGLADLQAIIASPKPPAALYLPKVKSADEIRIYDELLMGHCAHIIFHIIIETNEGLEHCHDIARASSRVASLTCGGVDLSADLRLDLNWEGMLYARSRIVHAAATAGIDVLDVPYLDFRNLEGMEEEALACKRLGFTGKAAVHPQQIPIINRVFSPSEEQIAYAKRVVAAFEEQGTGLVVVDNKLIEKPVLRSMYRLLAVAEKM